MEKLKRQGYFLFFSTGFFIGGLAGILILNCLISYRIDQYYNRIKTLESAIQDKNVRLEKLEDTINKNKLVVKNIEVTLGDEEDELTNIMLQKHIKEKLAKFIGKEVNKVDADILWEVIDQRIIEIEGKEYKLKANKLIISDIVHIWVQTQTQKDISKYKISCIFEDKDVV